MFWNLNNLLKKINIIGFGNQYIWGGKGKSYWGYYFVLNESQIVLGTYSSSRGKSNYSFITFDYTCDGDSFEISGFDSLYRQNFYKIQDEKWDQVLEPDPIFLSRHAFGESCWWQVLQTEIYKSDSLISLWCNPLFQPLMPYRMCKCNSLCCKDRIIKVKDKRYKTYNRKEWEHIISETFHADQDSCKQSI